jgi:hypothetical protein
LIVETDSGLVLGDSLVPEGLKQVHSLINNDVVLDIGILFVLNFEVVGGEQLDGEVGSTDGALVADDVCSFSNATVQDVVDVWFIGLCHGYDNF